MSEPQRLRSFENAHDFSITSANMAGRDINIYQSNATQDSIDHMLKLAEWLSPKNYRLYHNDTNSRRTPGTGLWFIQSSPYQLWLTREKGTLWVTGMPGAGKTFLAAVVIEDQRSLGKPLGTNRAVVFAYCRYMDSCTTRDILCTFLKQLVEDHPQIYQLLKPVFDSHKARQTHLTESEAIEQLSYALSMFKGVTAVIDGLDEVGDEEKQRLLDILPNLSLKVVILSRPLDLLVDSFSPDSLDVVSIEASNEDIEMFVLDRLRDSPRLRKLLKQKDSLEQLVTARIKEKSGGMFLVAALQVESLRRCMNLKALLSTLDSLPSGVDDMYKRTLARIDDQLEEESSLAKLALLWLAHAQRALKMDELQDALAVSLEDMTYDADAITPSEIILSVCCGLVVVDPSSNEARLVHYTAQEYIRKNNLPPFVDHPSITTLTCTTYLTHHGYCEQDLETFDALETFLATGPSSFLRYSQTFWVVHARQLSNDSSYDALAKTRNFLDKCRNVVYAFPTLQYFNFPFRLNAEHEVLNPCHVAARFGLLQLFPAVKHHDHQPTLRYRWTALHLAALMNQQEMLDCLLTSSPSLNINIPDKQGRTALHHAVQEGHESIVARLLAHPSINVNQPDSFRSLPLCVAAEERHVGVLSHLLKHRSISVNVADRHGESPFFKALLDGAPEVAECLLQHPSLDVNIDNKKESALQVAVRRGYTNVVKDMLSRRRLDINWVNNRGCTALHLAVHPLPGSEANPTLPLLLEREDISVNVRDSLGCIPLMVAVQNGRNEAARLLLAHPRIALASNSDGYSPLTEAVETENVELCDMILSHPLCDPAAPDSGRRIPLIVAMAKNNDGIFQMILSRLSSTSGVASSLDLRSLANPLMHAARSGRPDRVDALLNHPLTTEDDVLEALRQAILERCETAMEILLRRKIGVNPAQSLSPGRSLNVNRSCLGPRCPTLLMWACTCNFAPAVKALLQREELDVNQSNERGETALIRLCRGHPLDLEDPIFISNLPLHAADNSESIALLLSDPRTDVNRQDSEGFSALWHALFSATFYGRAQALKLLLGHPSVDVNLKDRYGSAPIHFAASMWDSQRSHLADLLAHPGMDVNIQDADGRTALHIAAAHRHHLVFSVMGRIGTLQPFNRPDEFRYSFTCRSASITLGRDLQAYGDLEHFHISDQSKRLSTIWSSPERRQRGVLEGLDRAHYNSSVISALLGHSSVDPNKLASDGWAPLHLACIFYARHYLQYLPPELQRGIIGMALSLIQHPAVDLRLLDSKGVHHCLEILLFIGGSRLHGFENELEKAVLERDPTLINFPAEATGQTILHIAVSKSDVGLVSLALECWEKYGVELDVERRCSVEGKSVAEIALKKGNRKILRLLSLPVS